MSASCQHLIWTIHFVIALMKWQGACSCGTCLVFFFQGVCVCVCELSMGKGLSAAECHILAARCVGSCQFVPWTEWEACSMQFSGWVFKCTWFCTAISSIPTFWVCLYCHTYSWEHYFATRCLFKRALVFQAVIGTVGVQDSSLWGQEAHAAPWLLQAAVAPSHGVRRVGDTRGFCSLSKVRGCTVWALGLSDMDLSKGCPSQPRRASPFKQVCNPGWGCLRLVTHKWLNTFLNLFLPLQLAFRQVSVSLQQGAKRM